MKNAFSIFLTGILVIIGILGLGWVATGNDFFLYKYFAPKYEQVRRETFEESKAYRQGMIQELQNMQLEYVKATPEQKQVLASVILHRIADFDEKALPPDLWKFVIDLKRDQGMK